MAAEVVDDHEMREAQRDYLDFLDDDVSIPFLQCCSSWSLLPWCWFAMSLITLIPVFLFTSCTVTHVLNVFVFIKSRFTAGSGDLSE